MLVFVPHFLRVPQKCPSRLEALILVIFVVIAGSEGVSCLNELHQLVHVEVLRIPDRVEPSCGRKILRR